jgi:RNA-directed DNA polymerase
MVARVTGTLETVASWENLWLAYGAAARGKRRQAPVARFAYRLEDELLTLARELRERRYRPGAYARFSIREPKRRVISAAPFRDRVVHHAVCQVIEPTFERSFIDASYANRRGRGTHRAIDAAERGLRRYRYVLPCDLREFFPSIDHAVLRATLWRQIADPGLRWLVDAILAGGAAELRDEYTMVWFAGDDLFAVNRPRGLPIGNLTSQFWANCHLNPFDHFVTRELGCGAYLRYVDDFLLFADDAATLWRWRAALIARLARMRLTLHTAAAQVRPCRCGVRFLGFVLRPSHRRLLRRSGIRFRRHLHALWRGMRARRVAPARVRAAVAGWVNHVRYAATWGLRRRVLGRLPR